MSLRSEEIFSMIASDPRQAEAAKLFARGGFFCAAAGRGSGDREARREQVLQMPVTIGKTNSISGLKSALDAAGICDLR